MRSITSIWLKGLTGGLAAVLLAGCAGDHSGSLSPLGALPPAAPRVTGLERPVEREHARLIAAFGGEYHAPEAQRMLAEVTARLVPATERPDENYQVTILDSPAVNAFALPSGRLYVTRGLLALANDVAEVAAGRALEIPHLGGRHGSGPRPATIRMGRPVFSARSAAPRDCPPKPPAALRWRCSRPIRALLNASPLPF